MHFYAHNYKKDKYIDTKFIFSIIIIIIIIILTYQPDNLSKISQLFKQSKVFFNCKIHKKFSRYN